VGVSADVIGRNVVVIVDVTLDSAAAAAAAACAYLRDSLSPARGILFRHPAYVIAPCAASFASAQPDAIRVVRTLQNIVADESPARRFPVPIAYASGL